MIITSNHYGIKFLSNRLQFEPRNDMFKVISDIMELCYDMYNTTTLIINFLHLFSSMQRMIGTLMIAIIMDLNVLIYYS